MREKLSSKGITLIALVITIIVLLILAGISIATLTGDEGILTKTTDAKNENSKAKEEEQVKLAVGDALTSGLGNLTTENLQEAIGTQFGEEKKGKLKGEGPLTYEGDLKTYTIDKIGNVISNEKNIQTGKIKWKQDGITITMTDEEGKETIIGVGDTILNYNPKVDENGTDISNKTEISEGTVNGDNDQIFNLSDYTGGWKVLGVDETSGQLIITTDTVIKTSSNSNFCLQGRVGYVNGIQEIDKISKLYGHGKYADTDKTRSINVDDINRITRYSPEKTGSGELCAEGQIWQYNNQVTYSWDGDKLKYSSNPASGWKSIEKFQYLDAEGNAIDLKKGENITFTCNSYSYYPDTLTNYENPELGEVQRGTNAHSLICLDGSNYWLGSEFLSTGDIGISYCLGCVGNNHVSNRELFRSYGELRVPYYGIRPVVVINSKAMLTGNSEIGWTIV